MNIKKPIARLNPKEMTLGVELKHKAAKKTKTLAEKKAEVLFATKQIIALKLRRNKLPVKSGKRPIIQSLINVAEKDLIRLRNGYKLPLV